MEKDGLPAILRWLDIVQLVDRHPALAEAGLAVAAAEGRLAEARQVPNPQLGVGLGRGSSLPPGEKGQEWSLELTIPLDWLAHRGREMEAARLGVEAVRQDARALRLEVLGELATLFWSLAHDQARAAALEQSEARAAQITSLIRRRVESGEARPIELPRIETELEKVRIALDGARALAAVSRHQLALWLGGGAEAELAVEAELEEIPDPPDRESLLERIGEGHPLILSGRARAAGLAARARAERRRRIPAFGAGGYWERELDRRAAGLQFRLDLPVWNWNRGAIARAEAEAAAEELRLETTRRELLAAAVEAHGFYLRDRQAALRYREEIIARATRAAEIVERAFQLGETGLIDVLDARRVLRAADEEYLAALLALRLDRIRLSALSGAIEDEADPG